MFKLMTLFAVAASIASGADMLIQQSSNINLAQMQAPHNAVGAMFFKQSYLGAAKPKAVKAVIAETPNQDLMQEGFENPKMVPLKEMFKLQMLQASAMKSASRKAVHAAPVAAPIVAPIVVVHPAVHSAHNKAVVSAKTAKHLRAKHHQFV